jgi:hypothetical protein
LRWSHLQSSKYHATMSDRLGLPDIAERSRSSQLDPEQSFRIHALVGSRSDPNRIRLFICLSRAPA